jgi:hypothetical protein
MRIAGRKLESDVSAPGEENPLETGIQSIPAIFMQHGWDENRHASRLHDSVDVGLHKYDCGLTMNVRGLIGGYSDERFHVPNCNQKKTLKVFETFRVWVTIYRTSA